MSIRVGLGHFAKAEHGIAVLCLTVGQCIAAVAGRGTRPVLRGLAALALQIEAQTVLVGL